MKENRRTNDGIRKASRLRSVGELVFMAPPTSSTSTTLEQCGTGAPEHFIDQRKMNENGAMTPLSKTHGPYIPATSCSPEPSRLKLQCVAPTELSTSEAALLLSSTR